MKKKCDSLHALRSFARPKGTKRSEIQVNNISSISRSGDILSEH